MSDTAPGERSLEAVRGDGPDLEAPEVSDAASPAGPRALLRTEDYRRLLVVAKRDGIVVSLASSCIKEEVQPWRSAS